MEVKDGWESFYASSGDGCDEIRIEYGREEVFTIRKDHEKKKEIIIELQVSETIYEIPLEWFLDVLQRAKKDFS